MKHKILSLLSIIIMTALCVGFASCGGDNPTPTPTPLPIPALETDEMLNTPLTLEAIEDGTIFFRNAATGIVTYKIDDSATQMIDAGASKEIPVLAGQKVSFYGDNETYSIGTTEKSNINSTTAFYVYGNIMSLINSTDFAGATTLTGEKTFEGLFSGAAKLKNHPSKKLWLPATTLTKYCYRYMFYSCTNLTSAPALPATTLAEGCYYSMFEECTNLVSAPDLPATMLAGYCYWWMFYNCSNLTYIKCLATNTSAFGCTEGWLKGVSTSGTFVKASDMTGWTSGADGIPTSWTIENSSQSSNNTEPEESSIKISLISRTGMSIKLQFDVAEDIDYFKYGQVGGYTFTEKTKKNVIINFTDLNPGKEYSFYIKAYNKDNKEIGNITRKFGTSSPPYTSYFCYDGEFFPVTSGSMTKQTGSSGSATGTNWKYLQLNLDGNKYVKFEYGVHEWESISSTWLPGTYIITGSSDYYQYNGFYYNGYSSKSRRFTDGKLTISSNGTNTIIDFECEDEGKRSVCHAEGVFN